MKKCNECDNWKKCNGVKYAEYCLKCNKRKDSLKQEICESCCFGQLFRVKVKKMHSGYLFRRIK